MDFTGFANSFTEGEISDLAWDRVDIQPVTKGVEAAINATIAIEGPLRKRRGFWFVGAVADPTKPGRLVPWQRGVDDCLMLEFGDGTCRVWLNNGQPYVTLLNGGLQIQFATPYADFQLAGLRWKQVADVIYFRTVDGTPPKSLSRANGGVVNADWTFAGIDFNNGPWLAENTDTGATVTLTTTGGPGDLIDRNSVTGAGAIQATSTVTLLASQPMFSASQVGAKLKLRANGSSVSALGWAPGTNYFAPSGGNAGDFVVSVGNMYRCVTAGTGKLGSNPPVQLQGVQSDGDNLFNFVHDGAGVILITAVTDALNAAGTVTRATPVQSGVATSYWSWGAYSTDQGWPTAWPEIREERLVDGATSGNLDWADLTQTAGFTPAQEDFTPGTGLGLITDVNAIRRRVGVDGGRILWFCTANYLVAGTDTGEHLLAGSVLDEPLSPEGITVKQLSDFGSDDVFPARMWNGLAFVQRGGQSLRWMAVDTQQGFTKDDYSVLAEHISVRGLAQLAWLGSPDQMLWTRLADGGLAVMTYHQEQQVRGWTRQQLPGGVVEAGGVPAPDGWTVEDVASLPGPGRNDTLWLIVSRIKGAVTERMIWQQSSPSDGLFMDGAFLFDGAPTSTFAGLGAYAGETLRALADGGQVDGLVPDLIGEVTLPAPASKVLIGFPYQVQVTTMKLAVGYGTNSLNQRQRIAGAIVSFKGVGCSVGLKNGGPLEYVSTRTRADLVNPSVKRWIRQVTLAGDGDHDGRDPRVVVIEDSAYDFTLNSIKPKVVPGG